MNKPELFVVIFGLLAFVFGILFAWFHRCKHKYHFVRTIHGDEINHCNGRRKVYSCAKCGKVKYE